MRKIDLKNIQSWVSYFLKLTKLQLQLLIKKVTKLQLLYTKSNWFIVTVTTINASYFYSYFSKKILLHYDTFSYLIMCLILKEIMNTYKYVKQERAHNISS